MPTIAWPRSEVEVRWYIGERLLPTGRVVVAEVAREVVGYMATEPGGGSNSCICGRTSGVGGSARR